MKAIITFAQPSPFRQELQKRVDKYFIDHHKNKRDAISMYLKAITMIVWMGVSYYFLVFKADSALEVIVLAMSLALALVGIGFNIQHDANHNGHSSRPWMNRIGGSTLDYFLGASSFFWKQKHNTRHHAFTNISESDDDINLSFIGRLSSDQKQYWFHRYQHWYLWFAYAFLHLRYLYSDFQRLIMGTMEGKRIRRPRGSDLAMFIFGKIVFFSLAFGVPLLLHDVTTVLLVYAGVSLVIGLVFSIVFQLAHMIAETEHPGVIESLPSEWAIHQMQTTANFAPHNKVLTWYLGGLNHQVEHHLFTDISHVHYPKLAPIVAIVSRESGVAYNVHKTFTAALRSHYLFLKHMGRS